MKEAIFIFFGIFALSSCGNQSQADQETEMNTTCEPTMATDTLSQKSTDPLEEVTINNEMNAFKAFLLEFLTTYEDANSSLQQYIHPEAGLYYAINPGVMCEKSKTDNIHRRYYIHPDTATISTDYPEGSFCEGYENSRPGYYFKTISRKKLPSYGTYEDGEPKVTYLEIPENISTEQLIEVSIINGKWQDAYLYFFLSEGQWYFLCQDDCDCSA